MTARKQERKRKECVGAHVDALAQNAARQYRATKEARASDQIHVMEATKQRREQKEASNA